MSKLQEQVKFHVTQMFHMLQAHEVTLSWFTTFGDHWRELVKLYPDPRWIASIGAAPYCPWCARSIQSAAPGVQQTPSPAPPESTRQTNPSTPPSGSVHYQVDLDILQGALVDLMIDDGYGAHTADMKVREAMALLKARGVFKRDEKTN